MAMVAAAAVTWVFISSRFRVGERVCEKTFGSADSGSAKSR
jgi:hypothetical protein